MKRLIFCFDGSWNKINEDSLTNVALTASAVAASQTVRKEDQHLLGRGLKVGDVIPQIVHYDEGVGTNRNEKYGGGIFGKGLFTNVREAYLFLCLNYKPNDEIYIFGFSRGAYTARSFAGLIGNCGIMRSEHIEKVIHAAELYKQRAKAETKEESGKLQEQLFSLIKSYGQPVTTCDQEDNWKRCQHGLEDHTHPKVDIKYIGVWDTVKSLFRVRNLFGLADPDTEFHDEDIPECAASGRHAVALDEFRKSFDYTPWHNVDEANTLAHQKENLPQPLTDYLLSPNRAFQEVWFPGTHGSVGGGGERRGLSDDALLWVLEGARAKGLIIDTEAKSKVFQLKPTPIDFIDNTAADGAMETYTEFRSGLPGAFKRSGPTHISEVSRSVIARYAAPAEVLPNEEAGERKPGEQYRPPALSKLQNEVAELAKSTFTAEDFRLYNGYIDSDWERFEPRKEESGWNYKLRTINQGEKLSVIAREELGSASKFSVLQACNKIMIPDADRIFAGQVINIPIGKASK